MSLSEDLGLKPFDAADYLRTPDDVVGYLRSVLAEKDADYLVEALATVARSPAMKVIEAMASDAGTGGRATDASLSIIGQIALTLGARAARRADATP